MQKNTVLIMSCIVLFIGQVTAIYNLDKAQDIIKGFETIEHEYKAQIAVERQLLLTEKAHKEIARAEKAKAIMELKYCSEINELLKR